MSAPIARACAELEIPVQAIGSALAARRTAERPLRVLLASPRHGDGTTTVAACVALSLCRNLRVPVALVEANPYRPALATYAACAPGPSFADVLRGSPAPDGSLRESFEPGLSLLPAGTLEPSERVDWRGPCVQRLLAELESHPFALIDAPPLLDRPAGRLLLAPDDLAVLVVRADQTTRADARAARESLEGAGAHVLGVVVNRFRPPWPFR